MVGYFWERVSRVGLKDVWLRFMGKNFGMRFDACQPSILFYSIPLARSHTLRTYTHTVCPVHFFPSTSIGRGGGGNEP